jgi:colanic acid/amylovoran biosynthesis protein
LAYESSSLIIGLLWHSVNSGNLGVGALTVSNLAIIRQACAELGITPNFIILGFSDANQADYVVGDDVEFVPITGRSILPNGDYGKAIRKCDIIIDIGGGDSWTDIYSSRRFAFIWFSKWHALNLGIPVILAPQTIGPFTRPIHSRLAKSIMRRCKLIVARDPDSYRAARAMSPDTKIHEAVDVAFALPSTPWPRGTGLPTIGVNVSALLFHRDKNGQMRFGMEVDYADYSRRLLKILSDRDDIRVVLISHVNSDDNVEDDGGIADKLKREFPRIDAVHKFASPEEAKSCIASLDFLVAGRMHACIAAFSSGVAVLPVAYSRKFSGLFEGVLGYSYGIPVRGVSTDDAVAMTLDAIEQRTELAAATRQGRDLAQQRLKDYGALLKQEFRALQQAR